MLSKINRYCAEPSVDNLTQVFMSLLRYAGERKILPSNDYKAIYELSYDLDSTDLRLAYMELKSFPSEKSVENMILVILMLFKGFGLIYSDFEQKVLDNH